MKCHYKIYQFFLGVALWVVLSGWGYTGHSKIAKEAISSVGDTIKGFSEFSSFITAHSSDPDFRKFWVKTESPKHFIDLDNYEEFHIDGLIDTSYFALVSKHGEAFVVQQGILPWATINAFDSLRTSFRKRDFTKAMHWAADLSHYVGDGHMPLHVTRNYDGQETGNKGIHARYESEMVVAYADSISFKAEKVSYIENPKQYVFSYLSDSYTFCAKVFDADNESQALAGNAKSVDYLQQMWKRTSGMTNNRFGKASTALASLIYTAWVDAGSPEIDTKTVPYACNIKALDKLLDSNLVVNYQINTQGTYKLDVRSADGTPLQKGGLWLREPGNYSDTLSLKTLPEGVYLITLDSENFSAVERFINK